MDDSQISVNVERIALLDQAWMTIASGKQMTADEGMATLKALAGLGVSFIDPAMEPVQQYFMTKEREATAAGDQVLATYAREVWESMRIIPTGLMQLADIANQVENRVKLVERVGAETEPEPMPPLAPIDTEEVDENEEV